MYKPAFTTILYGTLDQLNDVLELAVLDEQELRGALQNLLSHIQTIEKRLDKIQGIS